MLRLGCEYSTLLQHLQFIDTVQQKVRVCRSARLCVRSGGQQVCCTVQCSKRYVIVPFKTTLRIKTIDATLLSSCEPEIQELLRQVDGLLDSKRSEWESRVAGLKKQLQRRDGELCALRAALQRRAIAGKI
ncbi:centrosomal protein of 63 kDa-like [Corticium candelabrum]|uniref:centrosomal protein of 63 kDa-like n=1 Tax=Corticium candelabrum TaxID=121492 RepID=UPI002E256D1C|nr:centrosomal protein of 63 kDa-like [Corticium candelabrum]